MISALGMTASVVALLAATAGAYLGVTAGGHPIRARRAVIAALVAFGGLLAANGIMIAALVLRDFSVAYVAQVGSRATPLLYTVASLWGALEGSILFWALVLAGVSVLLIRRLQPPDRDLLPRALAVLMALVAFFAFIVVGPGNPWGRIVPAPLDGPGPNPLLQNHPLMAIHPPLLYVGFVGLAVPFALTMAALVQGRLDRSWLSLIRRWTLGPWVFLTLGLVAGAWWSYAVLGWGGYWAWDPVENVALLPWLTATALLHSAMVQERRGHLRTWNVALVIASFVLTIVATLVTRSGILDSVHSFTRSPVGVLFLGLLAISLVGAVAVAIRHWPGSEQGPPRLGIRTSAFLFNNLLLVGAAATVLVGTLFPVVVEALSGQRVSVGSPYFERTVGPIAVGLIVLLGIGPALPWGSFSSGIERRLLPGAASAAIAAVALALGGAPPEAVAGGAAGVFALVQSLAYMAARSMPRPGDGTGRKAVLAQVRDRRRSIGGLVVHAAMGVMALSIVASSSGRRDYWMDLGPGETASAAGYTLRFDGMTLQTQPARETLAATVWLRGSSMDAALRPALETFAGSAQAIGTPVIVAGATGDIYLVLTRFDPDTGRAGFRLALHPFQSWLWLGGGLAALGGVIAMWPRRAARRETVRSASARTTGVIRLEPPGAEPGRLP